MTFTRETVDGLRREINEALSVLGKKYGIRINAGNASFTATDVTFKLNLCDPAENWARSIAGTRLTKEDFGRTITLSGKRMKIVGFDHAARTNKVELESDAGKSYCASVDAVCRAVAQEYGSTSEPTPEGTELSKRAQEKDFEIKAFICGLKGSVTLGQTFDLDGTKYTIVDLNTRAPKYPIVAENNKGQRFRFTKECLGDAASADGGK